MLLNYLFQLDFRRVNLEGLAAELEGQDPFILETLRGIHAHREQLDQLIGVQAPGWRLERLVSVDRNLLRLGLYELLHTDTPPEVVINEAVELAKRFGTQQSAAFINGILDRVWKDTLHSAA